MRSGRPISSRRRDRSARPGSRSGRVSSGAGAQLREGHDAGDTRERDDGWAAAEQDRAPRLRGRGADRGRDGRHRTGGPRVAHRSTQQRAGASGTSGRTSFEESAVLSAAQARYRWSTGSGPPALLNHAKPGYALVEARVLEVLPHRSKRGRSDLLSIPPHGAAPGRSWAGCSATSQRPVPGAPGGRTIPVSAGPTTHAHRQQHGRQRPYQPVRAALGRSRRHGHHLQSPAHGRRRAA